MFMAYFRFGFNMPVTKVSERYTVSIVCPEDAEDGDCFSESLVSTYGPHGITTQKNIVIIEI
jgi:hypothetical protein